MPLLPIQLLLAEDHAADVLLLTQDFAKSSHGLFSVSHVKHLDEALVAVQSRRFDAVLLDLDLPDCQGIATLERMRQGTPRDIPIVVITASHDEALRALQAGADDYILKEVLTDHAPAQSVRYAIERKRAGTAFLASERRLSLAVDAAKMGIFDWDLETGNLSWSDQCLRLFGLTSEQFGGTYEAFERLVHRDDRARIRAKVDRSLADGSDFEDEYRVNWPDDSQHWIEARGRVFHDVKGLALRMVGTAMDVSQRKAAEDAARIRETEFAHLSRVATMGQMASGLAHELNQPLSASLNYATACLIQIEALTEFPPAIAESLQKVMDEIRRAGAIIGRMRSFVENQPPSRVLLDINQLVHDSIKMTKFNLQPYNVRVRAELAADLPHVLGDPVQIGQVLVNLLLNGAESMAGNIASLRSLTVRTEMQKDEDDVQVSIIDTGTGIPPENLGRLFQPFFSTKSKGLGMGLNISQSIIKSLGGRLWAAANRGRGMQFCFTVPTVRGAII